ncbi:MAG: starch-binding protein, partial [Candidatus Contendobacter sp.]|nr:starch-binding protein [Candidatus Contendobacter sp.]
MPELIIYFHKPAGWANTVHIHYWETQPGAQASAWPGAPMTAEAGGWFVHRIEGVEAASLVFNDDSRHQTGDLRRECSGFYANGRWHETQAEAEASLSSASDEHQAAAPMMAAPVETHPPIDPSGPLGDFREETIYFLMTTRFYDGDPSNNFFCRDRIKFNRETGKAEDPHWRGDFKGLIQRLDYIRDLGFTAIWITPPVENRSGLDYHGYHAYDWTRIDPRLESPDATYQDLIDEAHKRGIKIIQDVVVNHSCQYGIRGKVHIDHLPIKY